MALAEQDITLCRKGTPALDAATCASLLQALPQWHIIEQHGMPMLQRVFALPDFAAALTLANAIGALAEAADHHPRLVVEWGKLEVSWWTHTIHGLHRNDFIMAARCDRCMP
ncbi:MAG: 4a-hydroxytetrahydrobiopterin dehydratase [Pseudohongiellaceae bacterium]|jgi:4a-hydroxytetrahydrobiopterin dehydratase